MHNRQKLHQEWLYRYSWSDKGKAKRIHIFADIIWPDFLKTIGTRVSWKYL